MARPLTGTTLALTDTGTTALVVGGAVGATAGTGTILSGPIKIASATPVDTSMKLYNIAGTLTWNGTTLAAGSSVSGTTGKLPKFTSSNSVGDSIVAESGTIITVTGTLNATTAIQLNGTSINTGATLTNVAYLDQSNTFSNASGQKFAAGIGLDGGIPSTHGIMMPTGVPGVTTTTLYNNSGVLTWPATGVSVAGTLAVTGVATFTAQPILSSLTASQAVFSDASKGLVSNAITGSGNVVMSASPTLTGTIGAANMTLSGTLGVTGATTLSSTVATGALTVTGAATISTTLGVTGATTLSSTLAVTSLITSTGGITGGASSHTTGTFSSTLGVTGLITSTGGITGGASSHTTGTFSSTLTVAGLFADTLVGAHTFSGAGSGFNSLLTANTTAGVANGAWVEARSNETSGIRMIQTSSTYNTAPAGAADPPNVASAGTIVAGRGGGLAIVAANGTIKFYVGGATTIAGQVNTGANLEWGTQAAPKNGIIAWSDPNSKIALTLGASSDVAGGVFAYFRNASETAQGRIEATNSTTTAYITTSDQRLKTDLGLANDTFVLRNIKVRDFEWKPNAAKSRGVFAQEAVLVAPEVVSVGDDTAKSDGTLLNPWGVDYSKFVPDLLVGWQNHEARIAALEARLAIAEAPKNDAAKITAAKKRADDQVAAAKGRAASLAAAEAEEKRVETCRAKNDALNNLELTQEP